LSSRVDTRSTTSLEAQLGTDILEVFAAGKEGDLAHASGSEACSKVGRAGQNVTKMVIMHEVFAHALEDLGNDGGGFSESVEDGVNVVSLLHGDDPGVVLLVDPYEEVSSFVMEDSTGVGPVATTTR